VKVSPYKAVIIKLPSPKLQGKKGKIKTTVALSNTQSVFIHLCNLLPKQTYHVFTDNLFSSPNLFRALREAGCGATGTARPNCGINKELKEAKERNKAGNSSSLQYNEVYTIPTEDNQVRPLDRFISMVEQVEPCNGSMQFIYRWPGLTYGDH
jgi:hypothetical protein